MGYPMKDEENRSETPARPRKAYSPPAIIYSERVEARAVLCNKAAGTCTFGPSDS